MKESHLLAGVIIHTDWLTFNANFNTTSMPGIDQQLKVTHVDIPEFAKRELDDRFVLIYTGQRRLARNLLRDVVGRYVGNEPDSLFALEEIQKTAALMCF